MFYRITIEYPVTEQKQTSFDIPEQQEHDGKHWNNYITNWKRCGDTILAISVSQYVLLGLLFKASKCTIIRIA